MDLALRVLDPDDEHVLGEPALGACLPARDSQRVAFLAEQGIAAVARTEALDRQLLGEVHDESPLRVELAGGMQSLHEFPLARDALEGGPSHPGHEPHVEHHVGAVGDLDAASGERRIERPHAIGDHVHRASLHPAREQRVHLGMRLLRAASNGCWGRRRRDGWCKRRSGARPAPRRRGWSGADSTREAGLD